MLMSALLFVMGACGPRYDAKISEDLYDKIEDNKKKFGDEKESFSNKEYENMINQSVAITKKLSGMLDKEIEEGDGTKAYNEFWKDDDVKELNNYVRAFYAELNRAQEEEELSKDNLKRWKDAKRKIRDINKEAKKKLKKKSKKLKEEEPFDYDVTRVYEY